MAKKLQADTIKFVVDIEAKKFQEELYTLNSRTKELTETNSTLQKRLKAADKELESATKKYNKLGEAGLTASEDFKHFGNRISILKTLTAGLTKDINANKKEISENNKQAKNLTNTLKVEQMTMSQLKTRARELQVQLDSTSKAANPEAYASLDKQLKEVNNRMSDLNGGAKSAAGGFTTLKGGIAVMAGNLMTKAIDKAAEYALALKDWVAGGLEAAGVIEGVARAFNKLDKTGELLEKLRGQTRGLISDDDLQKAAVRADKYKIDIEQVGNLLEFAGRRATDMGKDVQDFQERIIDGIGKESKIILDDLGLTSTEINAAIASTGDFASGVIKVVNEELEKQGQLELTAADIRQQKTVAWENAQGAVGEKILWIEKIWNKFSIDFAGDVQEWASETLPGLIQKVVDLYNWFVDLYNESEGVRVIFEGLGFVFQTSWNTIKAILNTAVINIKALGNLIKAAFTLDWDLLKQAGEEYADSMKDTWKGALDETEDDFRNMAKRISSNKIDRVDIPLPGENEVTPTGQTLRKGLDPNAVKKQKTQQQLDLELLENKHQERLFNIKENYKAGTITSEAEFNRETFTQERANLLLREAMLDEFIKKTTDKELRADLEKKLVDARNKRLDQELKFRADLEKILLAADPVAKENKDYEERLSALNLFGVEKAKMTSEQLEAFEILERQHRENLDKIQKQGATMYKADAETKFKESFDAEKERLQEELNVLMAEAATLSSHSFDAEMAIHQKRLEIIRAEMKARSEAGLETTKLQKEQGKEEAMMTATVRKEVERRSALYAKHGNDIGNTLGLVMTGQVDALEGFGNATLDIMFDVISEIIQGELTKVMATSTSAIMRATAEAMATPGSALTFGAKGFATAAILTGAITAATAVAKTALKGMLGKRGGKSSSSSSDSGSSSGTMTVKQRAEGKYDVMGADDGQIYRGVPYVGDAKTGIVSRPTLMGERGSELVISHPDFMALQKHINYPVVLQAIHEARFGRVPQRAEGNYSTIDNSLPNYSAASGIDPTLITELKDAIQAFNNKKLNLGLSELQADLDQMNNSKKRFSQNQ